MADSKKARVKKELSKERAAALARLKSASSDQEKTVAKQQLKLVRFKEVASVRADAALRALNNLLNACDTTSYGWTGEQATKIIDALNAPMKKIIERLQKPSAKSVVREKFTL